MRLKSQCMVGELARSSMCYGASFSQNSTTGGQVSMRPYIDLCTSFFHNFQPKICYWHTGNFGNH